MISTRTRRLLHLTGSGLGIIGIVFVITRLVAYRDQLPLLDLPAMSWIELACLTAAYGICGSILALAWRQLLGWHGVRVARAWSVRAYGTSQLAKYIPGNIFHLAGRQAMGVAAGMPAWPFAKSIGWELATISGTAVLFVPLAFPLKLPAVGFFVSVASFAAVLALTWGLLRRFVSPHVASAVAWYAVFLSAAGLIFCALLMLISLSHASALNCPTMWGCVGGAYVLAWLAGLVTPGAPAGVGVREAVLYWLLRDVTGHAELITAILLGRAVTVGGDLLFFLGAILVRPTHSLSA
jgi:glycosyltransferase 2 family protein